VRDDRKTLGDKVVDSASWSKRDAKFAKQINIVDGPDGKKIGYVHPFSAGERNGFFANEKGHFADLGAISGLDSPLDSRCFGLIDYDRDGDQDIALINANSPSFQLYQTDCPKAGNYLALNLYGGAAKDAPALAAGEKPWSNRDAIGTRVVVELASGRKLLRLLNGGEGYASQNSKQLIIGLGEETQAKAIDIYWPSGRKNRSEKKIAAGQILTARETEAPEKWVMSDYRKAEKKKEEKPAAAKKKR
jgi:hypothetical protein